MSNPSLPSENAAHDEPLNHSSLSNAHPARTVEVLADRAEQAETSQTGARDVAGEIGGGNGHGSVIESAALKGLQDTPVSADKVEAQSHGQPNLEIDTPPASTSAPAPATASAPPALLDDMAPTGISAGIAAPVPVLPVSAPTATDTQQTTGQDKRNRGPPKQSGPSLLSQALASARGITQSAIGATRTPTSGLIKAGAGTLHSAQQPPSTQREIPATPIRAQHGTQNDLSQPNEAELSGQIEAQNPPASMATATATIVPASTGLQVLPSLAGRDAASVPSSFEQSARENAKTLLERHGFLDQDRGRTSTSLDINRHTLHTNASRSFPYSTSPEDVSTPTNTTYMASAKQLASSPPKASDLTDTRSTHQRPTGLQQRATLGPEKTEKMWSIGAGEGSEEDGQVEKSVAEAMAGVEHNARSRKASYSLRFFKEGLPPEDKARRKDTKVVPKDKLSPTVEEKSVGSLGSLDKDPMLTPPATAERTTPRSVDVRQSKAKASGKTSTTTAGKSDVDYFTFDKGDATIAEPASSSPQPKQRPEGHGDHPSDTLDVAGPVPATDSAQEEGHSRKQPPATSDVGKGLIESQSSEEHAGTDAEIDHEAEDSGEEKISSAVFLPHQELTESDVIETLTRDADWTGPRQRSLSQSKTRPWLVKADEPEPEPQEEVIEDHDEVIDQKQRERAQPRDVINNGRVEQIYPTTNAVSVKAECEEPRHVSPRKLPLQVLPTQDDHVHDHQADADEQLEAIELKPYKHQVGGHTTLWRFSRRAVCKQLNNRENEFYEIIERYHRDLLSFLPR